MIWVGKETWKSILLSSNWHDRFILLKNKKFPATVRRADCFRRFSSSLRPSCLLRFGIPFWLCRFLASPELWFRYRQEADNRGSPLGGGYLRSPPCRQHPRVARSSSQCCWFRGRTTPINGVGYAVWFARVIPHGNVVFFCHRGFLLLLLSPSKPTITDIFGRWYETTGATSKQVAYQVATCRFDLKCLTQSRQSHEC